MKSEKELNDRLKDLNTILRLCEDGEISILCARKIHIVREVNFLEWVLI